MVEDIIHKLKRNKTPGQDGLTVEHSIFAHSLVIIIVTKFLNLVLRFEHVQNEFGSSKTYPIPKGTSLNQVVQLLLTTIGPRAFQSVQFCLKCMNCI